MDTSATEAQLREIVADVKVRAPRVRVMLVGYRPLAPRGGGACPALGLADGRAVAAAAQAEGVEFVTPPDDGMGCARARRRGVCLQ